MADIIANKELCDKLVKAQREHLVELLQSEHDLYSDDGWDYLQAACRLMHELLQISYHDNWMGLWRMLNEKGSDESLEYYACDGIASAFYELNCNTLED